MHKFRRSAGVRRSVLRRVAFAQAVAAMLMSACGSSTEATPDVTGAASRVAATARFTLKTVGGRAAGAGQATSVCSTVFSGSLEFDGWPGQATGRVVIRHTVSNASAPGGTATHVDTATYTRSAPNVIDVRYGPDAVGHFTIDATGTKLETTDSGCYPAQREFMPDMLVGPISLVYERQD